MVHTERILFLIGCCLFVIEAKSLEPFREHLLQTKIDLVRSFKSKRDVSPLNVKWNPVWRKSIEHFNSALIQNVNNKIFILSKDAVYNIDGNPSFKLVPIKSLQGLSDQISFLESIEWNNILFLLLGFNNGQCRLMTATNEWNFSIRQTITNSDTPVDAEFFILNNELFVVIIFNQEEDSKASLKIYRWRNTLLDEEPPNLVKTVGAISVTTFTSKNSAILIIGQKTKDEQKISSQVLKMKSNGVIEKVQYLQTQDLVSIKHFTMDNEQFVMVLEKNQSSIIYWWEGMEFVKWLSLPDIYGEFTLSIGYIRDNTLILLYKENGVAVYSMTWQKLHKVLMVGFSGQVLSAALYDDDKMYLVVVTKEEVLKIQLIELDIDSSGTQSDLKPRNQKFDPISQCVKKLEDSINMVEDSIRYLQETLPNVLYSNQPAVVRKVKVLGAGSGIDIESGNIKEVLLQNDKVKMKTQMIDEEITKISNKISLLEKSLQEEKTIPHSKILIFANDLFINEAKINTINADVINNIPFDSGKIISLSKNQRLKSDIIAPAANIQWLLTKYLQNKVVEHLVPNNNSIETAQFVSSLTCNNMETSSLINGINITNMVTKVMDVKFDANTSVDDLIIKTLLTQNLNEVENVTDFLASKKSRMFDQLKLSDNTLIKNINVKKINGIDIENFLQSLVLRGQNNSIKGNVFFQRGFKASELIASNSTAAVTSDNLNYMINDLLYQGKVDIRQKRGLNITSPHRQRKLLIYKGKVKVKGDLKVTNLHFKNATLHVKSQPFPITMDNIDKTFWTKHSKQSITVPVTFLNGVTVEGSLDVCCVEKYKLHNYDYTQYILSDLKFQNISVSQSITSGTLNSHKIPDFQYLRKVIVKQNGTYVIKGKQGFAKTCVDHLHAEDVNNISPKLAFVHKSGASGWENVIVSDFYVKGNINTYLFNNVNISEKLENIVLTDMNYTLSPATFQVLSGAAIKLKILNGLDFDKISQLIKKNDNINNFNIYFNGSLHVPAITATKSINKKELMNILPLIVNGSNPAIIKGKKTFKSQVTVENDIATSSLNGEHLESILDSRLRKSQAQRISGYYTIKNGELRNIMTDDLNGMNVSNFILINDPVIHITSDVEISELVANSNIMTEKIFDGCFLPKVEETLIFPHDTQWSSLYVNGDVQWKSNVLGKIQKLIQSAVTRNESQEISGNVDFVQSSMLQGAEAKLINTYNIPFIWQDAVIRSEPNQIISGNKIFVNKISFSHGSVSKDLRIPIINKINVTTLMNKIILKNVNHSVSGHKVFKNGFHSFKFTSEVGMNGIKDSDIATENTRRRLPYAVFNSLEILESMKVRNVNNINVSKFVQDIVRLDAKLPQTITGQIVFKDSIQLMSESTITTINSMDVASVLLAYDINSPQNIIGCTNITKTSTINGTWNVDRINKEELNTIFKKAILDNESYTIQGDIVFENKQIVPSIHGKQYFLKDVQIEKMIKYIGQRNSKDEL